MEISKIDGSLPANFENMTVLDADALGDVDVWLISCSDSEDVFPPVEHALGARPLSPRIVLRGSCEPARR